MTNLSDTQRVLLSHASQRGSGSLLPLPNSIRRGGGTAKAIDALVKHGFADERETGDPVAVRRTESDIGYGVFITAVGASAIGIEPDPLDPVDEAPVGVGPATPSPTKAPNKTATVLTLLGRAEGATMPELIGATGWLPHSTRAALTGLRKKGHAVDRSKRDGATCYRIVMAS